MPLHIEDLEYLRTVGAAPLLARFYRPEGTGPFPAVLEVHGGAWTSGDRLNNVAIGEYLAARGISSALYGVRPTDFVAAGGAALALAVVAAIAAYLPSRRASRLDPMEALRAD